MRIVINLLLTAVIVALGYLTFASIRAPINFKKELDRRESAVIQKLMTIRKAQEIYRDITGGTFADSWQKLKDTLTHGDIMYISIIGDPDDPDFDVTQMERDTTYSPAIDTVKAMGIDLDNISIVPFTDGKEFDVDADTLRYQSTRVNVVEVGTKYSTFMGQYGASFAKYDKRYDPDKKIKFGDMKRPTTAGSWDR